MSLKLIKKDTRLHCSSRAGLGMALLGSPIAASGLLMIGAALREIVLAAMDGSFIETPSLFGVSAFRIGISVLFLGLGLLMIFGGTYMQLDTARRQIRLRHFFGLFTRSATYDFAEVVQVVLRAEQSARSFQSRNMNQDEGPRRSRTVYKIELELRDGRRALLASHNDKASVHAAGAQIAACIGVSWLDIGLVGSQLRRTGA